MDRISELAVENDRYRMGLRDRKRIVIKIGSSSLLHKETARLDYHQIDILARELSDLKNRGKDVILVSSGAAAAGREALKMDLDVYKNETEMNVKQACAAVGQARLMMIYQKAFEEYNQLTAQVLMSRATASNPTSKENLNNTMTELLRLGVIPIVNENDSVATAEFSLGDNDNLSAIVASLMGADLLILLSDVRGLYTDDPRRNKDAQFISYVPHLTEQYLNMGKDSTGSGAGTGGMATKLHAAKIAAASGCDMIIASTENGTGVIYDIVEGANIGTLFRADKEQGFDLSRYLDEI